jgi:CheY-like chemotaxis protein
VQTSPKLGSGAVILVVDDDALITLNTVDLVTEMGHSALEAFSGREALTLLEQRSDISAMITDYSMPGMSGIELIEAARKLRPDLPVLLATGYSELPENVEIDVPRLEKPFREEELAQKLGDLLGTAVL